MSFALSLRSPFRRKVLASLLLLSMLLVVALCDSEEVLNYQTCYREIKGCEQCKKCTNSVSKDECACARPTGGADVLCDDVCMKNEDHSYREKRSWRVLGITLFSISIITIVGIFVGTLVYWSKADTADPKSKVTPPSKELAVIEAPPQVAIGDAAAAGEGGSAWTKAESAAGSGGSGGTGGSNTTGSTGTDKSSSVPAEEPRQDVPHIAPRLVASSIIH